MKSRRVLALILGCLLLLPGLALLLAGGALGAAYAFDRDSDGYISATIDRLESPTAAVTTGDLDLVTDPGSPDWLLERLGADVRLEVTSTARGAAVFVGIAPALAVDAYLADVAHDQVIDATGDTVDYRRIGGQASAAPPAEQAFWVGSASGVGTQRLDWKAVDGRWAIVVMNADGSPGLTARATTGAKAGVVLPLAVILLALGALATAGAALLVVLGARDQRTTTTSRGVGTAGTNTTILGPSADRPADPVTLGATLDPGLSRWSWLVKWVLIVPHLLVLAFLWTAFGVLTLVAAVSILFTGTYPRRIFDVNVGVLRWSWRVSFYATTGGIGTDRYPPFRLSPDPAYPATLDVRYPARLSKAMVLVKWLLALPHLVIVSLFVGGSVSWSNASSDVAQPGLLGLLVLVAGLALLATGRYPRGVFDLIIGLNRWLFRVIAYVALLTDQYPPFRLDQGGTYADKPDPSPLPVGTDVVDLTDLDRQRVTR